MRQEGGQWPILHIWSAGRDDLATIQTQWSLRDMVMALTFLDLEVAEGEAVRRHGRHKAQEGHTARHGRHR